MARSQNYFIGIWRFSESLPETQLHHLASKWAKDPHYLHLYVRRVASDQWGLGFTYKPEQEGSYETYFQKTFSALKQDFGDLLIGWDIASNGRLIKG